MKLELPKGRPMSYPAQIYVLGMGLALPWFLMHIIQSWVTPIGSTHLPLIYSFLAGYSWLVGSRLWRRCQDPFYTLANLVRSLQQEDYSRRGRLQTGNDALGLLIQEINHLAESLRQSRLASQEQNRRFNTLVDYLEVAVLAVDDSGQIRLGNRLAGRFFQLPPENLCGRALSDFALDEVLTTPSGSILTLVLPGRTSRFLLHRTPFREHGRPSHLIVLTDLSSPLREEERTAWKRLIRVLGHELNNSLTPILSLSDSLRNRLAGSALPEQERESYCEALGVVNSRATNLRDFIREYSALAKLPPPKQQTVAVEALVLQTTAFINSPRLTVLGGPACWLRIDAPQIEQVLINLIRNAMEATEGQEGRVWLSWRRETVRLVMHVEDDGPGISEPENLFVPFFSTKPGGSGIGLVLSRQIAEAHGGTLILESRAEGGCRAVLTLPLDLQETGVEKPLAEPTPSHL